MGSCLALFQAAEGKGGETMGAAQKLSRESLPVSGRGSLIAVERRVIVGDGTSSVSRSDEGLECAGQICARSGYVRPFLAKIGDAFVSEGERRNCDDRVRTVYIEGKRAHPSRWMSGAEI